MSGKRNCILNRVRFWGSQCSKLPAREMQVVALPLAVVILHSHLKCSRQTPADFWGFSSKTQGPMQRSLRVNCMMTVVAFSDPPVSLIFLIKPYPKFVASEVWQEMITAAPAYAMNMTTSRRSQRSHQQPWSLWHARIARKNETGKPP